MKVEIKTWVEMETEFGLNVFSDIDIDTCSFTVEMEEEMPDNRELELSEKDDDGDYIWNDYFISPKIIKSTISKDGS